MIFLGVCFFLHFLKLSPVVHAYKQHIYLIGHKVQFGKHNYYKSNGVLLFCYVGC